MTRTDMNGVNHDGRSTSRQARPWRCIGFACFVILVNPVGSASAANWQAEAMRIEKQNFRAQEARRTAAKAALSKAKPLKTLDPDSLSLSGTGLGASSAHLSLQQFQLATGTLNYAEVRDFNERYILAHLDKSLTYRDALREQKDAIRRLMTVQGLPASMKALLQRNAARLMQVRSARDLAMTQTLSYYERALTGKAALNGGQLARIRQGFDQRQRAVEEIARLALSGENGVRDGATAEKITELFNKQSKVLAFMGPAGAFFTPLQRQALGYDGRARRSGRSVAVSASAGGGGGAVDQKAWAKEEAKREAADKARRKAAKVKFTLAGKEAQTTTHTIKTSGGAIWMYVEALADGDGANFDVCLDEKDTWPATRTKWLKEWYGKPPKGPKEKSKHEARKSFLGQAASFHEHQWGSQVNEYRLKIGSVPERVEARLKRMLDETEKAAEACLVAYRAAAEKPKDRASQRALFEAAREALRVETRNRTLALYREHRDPDGTRDDLPWLWTLDQLDELNRGQLVTSSSVTSGTHGTISVRARPAGKKQYVAITHSGQRLGELAEHVQKAARQCYHNHRLKLEIDKRVAEKAVRGTVEGKSLEQLLRSLATRSGTRIEQDKTDKNVWRLLP